MADLEEMRAFVALAELGSITQAAAKLRTSRARLRRKLASLEERTQVQLLSRVGGVLTPTAPGVALMEGAKRLLGEATLLITHAREIGMEPTGLLRVALQPGFPFHFTLATAELLEARYPLLRVEVRVAEDPLLLLPEDADLAIVLDYSVDAPECTRLPIVELRCQLLATETYLSQHGSPTSPEDLANHRLLVWRSLSEPPDRLHLADGSHRKIEPGVISTNERFLLYYAAAHKGIAYVPYPPYPDPDFPELRPILAHQIGRPVQGEMYVPNILKDVPRVKAVLDAAVLMKSGPG